MDLRGKVALVTGAATGIGLEYAKLLLHHGVKHVAIVDVNQSAGEAAIRLLNDEYGLGRAMLVICDVTKKEALEGAFKRTVDELGPIDVVVNNAGIMRDNVWELEIDLNFTTLVRSTLLALDHMSKNKGGRGGVIVNIASVVGLYPMSLFCVYTGTKSAVIAFSQSIGAPFHEERTGVRVLTLCPAVTDTPLISDSRQYLMDPAWAEEHWRMLKHFPSQTCESVANGLIHILKNARSGSVWVAEGGEPVYELNFPRYETLKV